MLYRWSFKHSQQQVVIYSPFLQGNLSLPLCREPGVSLYREVQGSATHAKACQASVCFFFARIDTFQCGANVEWMENGYRYISWSAVLTLMTEHFLVLRKQQTQLRRTVALVSKGMVTCCNGQTTKLLLLNLAFHYALSFHYTCMTNTCNKLKSGTVGLIELGNKSLSIY